MSKPHPIKPQSPWQLLVIGGFFLLGAVICLCQKGTVIVEHAPAGKYGGIWRESVSPDRARVYGLIYLFVTLICLGLYLKIRAEFTGWRFPKFRRDKKWNTNQ